MNKPFVSWLMTVYNDEEFLSRAMDSMLNQSYTNFEIVIIVEYNCTDNTISICEQYARSDSRVHVFVNDERLGFPRSLNRGIALCQGKYIARMDADDVSYIDRLEKQVSYMEKNPDVDILGSQAKMISTESQSEYISKWYDCEYIKAKLLFSCCIVHPSTMIRIESFMQNNWQYPDCEAEDYALWSSLISKVKMHILPELLMERYIHGENACVVRFDEVRKASAKISRKAISSELGINVESFPDNLFGWQDKDATPYDLNRFLTQSAELLCMIYDANQRLNKFDKHALQNVLTEQWSTSKSIAKMNMVTDDYTVFTEDVFNDAINKYYSLYENNINVVIYGIGNVAAQILCDLGESFPFNITAVFDSDKGKHGQIFEGQTILSPERHIDTYFNYILVGSPLYFEEIKSILTERMYVPANLIFSIEIANDILFHVKRKDYQ